MPKILVIDDDISILNLVKNALKNEYDVTIESDVTKVNIKGINQYDLLILDVMMPKLDGFTFIRERRREIDIPVIFLTAKSFENDLLEGLASGADDYITKPFSLKELRARVIAHLRRENREKKHLLRVGNIFCDLINKSLFVNEVKIELTDSEYRICELLIKNRNRIFTKIEIYENLYGDDGIGDPETSIRVRVNEIRKKLNLYGEDPIKTVWRVGYQWEKNQ